jgi:RNA polymerase sigma factor (sigma-70 family)
LIFESFSEDYVRRLTDGDSATGAHFAAYFSSALFLKLRVRLSTPESIEDARQETLMRVLAILRRGGGVERPERFGAFVSGVCENVIREMRRVTEHDDPWDENTVDEPIDPTMDLDADLINAEAKGVIGRIFAILPEKDRQILQAIYLDDIPKPEVCRRFKISAAYLRVLIWRAKLQFRNAYHCVQGDGRGDCPKGETLPEEP